MGCAPSKRTDIAVVDVYRPAPTSLSLFDVNSIEEPWLKGDDTPPEQHEKPAHLPAPLIEKLNTIESDTPHSWNEVSKALEVLKPSLNQDTKNPVKGLTVKPPPPVGTQDVQKKQTLDKSKSSIHTVQELDVKLRKTQSAKTELPSVKGTDDPGSGVKKTVKENIFIVRDRLEREKEGKQAILSKRLNPLADYPEKCPPGGTDTVVLYTTSLSGVRRTYEDCNKVRNLLELHQVVFDERDVALHGGFRKELKELLGEEEGVSVPRMFVKGKYIGGTEEVMDLNDRGQLMRMLRWAGVERGVGRLGCNGCGGARFVPCFDCGGSCKVVNGDGEKERCGKCNENGLIHCPACL